MLGVSGPPAFRRHHAWPHAIPQYNLGYDAFLAPLAATEAAHRNLFIGGHVRDGISVPDCLAAGSALAGKIASG